MSVARVLWGGLYRHRDFRLLWGAEAVSQLGSMVTFVALPLIAVTTLHASAFAVGALTASSYMAWVLVALPAGVWVERMRRRPVLVSADLGRAILLASVPVAWSVGVLTLAQLIIVALLTSVLTVFFDITYRAYLPLLVDKRVIGEANGRLSAVDSVTHTAGPGLGGVLVQSVGPVLALIADIWSFVVSAICLRRIDHKETSATREVRTKLTTDLSEGLRFVFGHPVLRAIAAASGTANIGFAAYHAIVVVFLAREVGLSAKFIGVLLGCMSVGGLVGSLVIEPVGRRVGDARTLWLSLVVGMPIGLLVPLTTGGVGLVFFVVGTFSLGAGIVANGVCTATFIQVLSPARLLVRAGASVRLVSRGALPIGGLTGGALAQLLGPRPALAVMLGFTVVAPVWLIASPVIGARSRNDLLPPEEAT